jgi:hypothetical protein
MSPIESHRLTEQTQRTEGIKNMSTEKKERVMGPKGFLHKASGKVSADAFLAQHRAWLETGDLSEWTSPILAKVDAKEVMPTPALETIKGLVFAHMMAMDAIKAEKAIEDASKPTTQKPYLATVYDSTGAICTRINDKGKEVELIQAFELGQRGRDWLDRRLFEGASDWFGVLTFTKDGKTENIMRQDSIARILKQPRNPVMNKRPQQSKLGWGMKVKGDHFHSSKG